MATRIDKGTFAKGKLDSKEEIIVEGRFEGEILTTAKVTIQKGSFVRGPLKCREIDVFGIIEGDVFAEECARVFSFGKIQGNLKTGHLFVEDGGILAGKIETEGRTKILPEETGKKR